MTVFLCLDRDTFNGLKTQRLGSTLAHNGSNTPLLGATSAHNGLKAPLLGSTSVHNGSIETQSSTAMLNASQVSLESESLPGKSLKKYLNFDSKWSEMISLIIEKFIYFASFLLFWLLLCFSPSIHYRGGHRTYARGQVSYGTKNVNMCQ